MGSRAVAVPSKCLLNIFLRYTLSTPSGNNKNKAGEAMALRVKARFISTRVLPTEMYKRFAEHVSNNYLHISHALSNIISVTRKDEIARILVNIMFGTGCLTVSRMINLRCLMRVALDDRVEMYCCG